MRSILLSSFLLLLACSSGSSSTDSRDASVYDGAGDAAFDGALPDGSSDSRFSHCPSAFDFVGDERWEGTLTVSNFELCAYPARTNLERPAMLGRKLRLRIVDGEYRFPYDADGAPYRLPMCLERQGGDTPPAILAGSVRATLGGPFIDDDPDRYYLSAEFPLSDGGALSFAFNAPRNGLEFFEPEESDLSKVGASLCEDEDCENGVLLAPCSFVPNVCDALEFQGGTLTVDQLHWAGPVGAGFAAPIRARGMLDGTPFDVSEYERMTIEYGHHAFARSLYLRLPAAVGQACAIRVSDVAEGPLERELSLLDCDGNVLTTREVTSTNHTWGSGCDSDS